MVSGCIINLEVPSSILALRLPAPDGFQAIVRGTSLAIRP